MASNSENFSASNLLFNIFLLLTGIISAVASYYFISLIRIDYKECSEGEMIFTEWSECTENTVQVRTVTPLSNCKIPPQTELQRPCQSEVKNVYLFKENTKEYSTKINLEDPLKPYIDNKNNVQIIANGKFESAKLKVKVETTIFDGTAYKIPEFYYLFFGMNEEISRVLGTSRVKDNRLDVSDYGVFQGTETPKELSFDLEQVKLANPSGGNPGFGTGKYVSEVLNSNDGNIINVTLFVADGRSMSEPDEMKRIYGTITDAVIEYVCENGNECEIQRIPPLPI